MAGLSDWRGAAQQQRSTLCSSGSSSTDSSGGSSSGGSSSGGSGGSSTSGSSSSGSSSAPVVVSARIHQHHLSILQLTVVGCASMPVVQDGWDGVTHAAGGLAGAEQSSSRGLGRCRAEQQQGTSQVQSRAAAGDLAGAEQSSSRGLGRCRAEQQQGTWQVQSRAAAGDLAGAEQSSSRGLGRCRAEQQQGTWQVQSRAAAGDLAGAEQSSSRGLGRCRAEQQQGTWQVQSRAAAGDCGGLQTRVPARATVSALPARRAPPHEAAALPHLRWDRWQKWVCSGGSGSRRRCTGGAGRATLGTQHTGGCVGGWVGQAGRGESRPQRRVQRGTCTAGDGRRGCDRSPRQSHAAPRVPNRPPPSPRQPFAEISLTQLELPHAWLGRLQAGEEGRQQCCMAPLKGKQLGQRVLLHVCNGCPSLHERRLYAECHTCRAGHGCQQSASLPQLPLLPL